MIFALFWFGFDVLKQKTGSGAHADLGLPAFLHQPLGC